MLFFKKAAHMERCNVLWRHHARIYSFPASLWEPEGYSTVPMRILLLEFFISLIVNVSFIVPSVWLWRRRHQAAKITAALLWCCLVLFWMMAGGFVVE